jgi:hypothetical protein
VLAQLLTELDGLQVSCGEALLAGWRSREQYIACLTLNMVNLGQPWSNTFDLQLHMLAGDAQVALHSCKHSWQAECNTQLLLLIPVWIFQHQNNNLIAFLLLSLLLLLFSRPSSASPGCGCACGHQPPR